MRWTTRRNDTLEEPRRSHTSFCSELVCTAMSGTVTIATAANEAGDVAQPCVRNVSAA